MIWFKRKRGKCDPAVYKDFKSLLLNIFGSMASMDEFELVKSERGAMLSFYRGWWDTGFAAAGVSREDCLERRISVEGARYDELIALFNEYNLQSWNGFSGSNPYVLDGGGFRFEMELSGGELITASGNNAYPSGYNSLSKRLYELIKDE